LSLDLPRVDILLHFSVHPEGKRVLLQAGGVRYDLYTAEGFAQPARGLLGWFRHWEIPEGEKTQAIAVK